MSLIQKPSMTDKNRTAHQRNGRQSRGAATPAGKERNRAAHLRHGFYSQQREEALGALGEGPAELAALIASTREEWCPANDFQERMAERMARLWWRTERAERIQESLAAREAQELKKRRHERALELRYQLAPQVTVLHMLQEYSSYPRFYVPRSFFGTFQEGFGVNVQGARKRILLLMHQLRKPQGPPSAVGASGARSSAPLLDKKEGRPQGGVVKGACPPGERVESAGVEEARPQGGVAGGVCPERGTAAPTEEAEDQYLADMEELEELDDDDSPIPWPETPIAEGAERDELREAVGILARIEMGTVHAEFDPQIEEQERPLSRIEQDEAQAAPHKHADLMRREEGSCFRQFMRLANLLMKVQKQSEKYTRNEGSSGDVDENTEGPKTEPETVCPEPVNASNEGSGQTVRDAGSEVRSPRSGVGKAESAVRSPGSEHASARAEAQRDWSEVGRVGSEIRSPGSGVGNGLSPEVKQAAAHGSIPNSAFRIPEKRGIEVGGERSAVLDRK